MKELTAEEFRDRMEALQRAERIFMHSGLTDNITTAFTIYQEVLAERKRQVFLEHTASTSGESPYVRPACPDCGAPLRLRALAPNNEGVRTQWVCSNVDCDLVLDSPKTVEEWMTTLKVKGET